MSYRIKRKETVADGVRRVAIEQVEQALAEAGDDSPLSPADAVHQVRKRCKKIRAVARIVRPGNRRLYKEENAFFRDLADDLSGVRDLDAMRETLDALVAYFGDELDASAFQSVRDELHERRKAAVAEEAENDTFDDIVETLEAARTRVEGWDIDGEEFGAVAGGVLKTYRRGRKAMEEAFDEKTAVAFHEWRKRVKYHWSHMRLLRDVWTEPMKARCKVLDELADVLGDEHDLSVFRSVLTAKPDDFGSPREMHLLVALIDRRRDLFQARARPLGMRLFGEKPKRFVKRIGGYWRVWRKEDGAQSC